MTKTVLAAALLSAAIAAPALAQDVPAPDRTTGEVVFTGLRIEGRVGYSHQDIEIFDEDIADELDIDNDFGSDGVQLGVGLGYDFDVSGFVVGVETGVDWTVGESKLEFDDETIDAKVAYGRDFEVGGRIGFRAGDNFLVYGKGGYTNLRIDTRSTAIIEAEGEDGVDRIVGENRTVKLDGWRIGGGVEMALPVGFFGGAGYGKIEYRHSEYDENVSKDEVLLGLGFRF